MPTEWFEPLVEAIPQRHSVRAYSPGPLTEEQHQAPIRFFGSLSIPFEHNVRPEVFKAEPGKNLYNNGINPVDNMAIFAQTDLVSVSKAGFIGELLMLHTVGLGLSTCWFGHYKLSELGRYFPDIATPQRLKESTLGYGYGRQVDVGERAICCMPFGQKDARVKRLVDRVAGMNGAKRKPLEALMETPESAADIPGGIRQALELAALAPSAANSQMWRFGLAAGAKTITVAKPVGYRHFKWEHPDADVGMCAAHLWLGLLGQGYSPKVSVVQDADRALWRFGL